LGHVYQMSARIRGKKRTWNVVLATGKNMFRLSKAWNQVIGELGPMQSSEKVAATILAMNLHPRLYGYAPLKIGNAVELKSMHKDMSVARIYTPDTMNSNLDG